MGAVWFRFRGELHSRLWSWVAIALVVGCVGGGVLMLAAGARRTDSAYTRFLTEFPASDFTIADSSDFGFSTRLDLEAVRRLPQVENAARASGLIAASARTGDGRELATGIVVPFAPQDRRLSRTVERWKLLEGRRANPRRVDEVVVGFQMARVYDLEIGSTLRIEFVRRGSFVRLLPRFLGCLAERITADPSPECAAAQWAPKPPDLAMTFRVVGIQASALEFPPYEGNLNPPVHLTRAFTDRYGDDLLGSDILLVRLRPGANHQAFLASVAAVSPGTKVSVLSVGADHARTVQRAIHLQAVGLGVLAVLVGLSVAFALSQAFARQAYVALADDIATLRALGASRGQFVAGALGRAGLTAGAGALLAVAIAVALSPLWPLGLAGEAEPNPGLAIDGVVLGLGAVAIVAIGLVAAGITTARLATRTAPPLAPTRPSVAARLTERIALPVPVTIGVRQALEPGRGRTAVPVRSAIAATALAVTVLVAAMTLASSTDHLLATRHLYGWSRDAQIGSDGTPPVASAITTGLESAPGIQAFASGTVTDVEIRGTRISAFALDDLRGAVPIDLLAGRRPRAPDEIVLGTVTMDETDVEIGDRIQVGMNGQRRRMTVVGRAVFSRIGSNGQLGRGAQITFAALERVLPGAPRNVVQIDFEPDADASAVRAQLQLAVAALPVIEPAPPTELTSFGRVDNLPALLAIVMVLVAAVILGHAMVTSVQRRRRDFAILEALGFVRAQVAASVVVQATTFAVVATLIGIPLGLLVGPWIWGAIADELAVPSEPTADARAVALVVPAMIILANAVAAVPAWFARRMRPGRELRVD